MDRHVHELIHRCREDGHQSDDNTPLVICYNRNVTRFVWSHRQPSTAARAAGGQSSLERKCVFVCVFDGSPAGKESLVSQFSALIGVNEQLFCYSFCKLIYFFLCTMWRQNDTLLGLETWHHLSFDAQQRRQLTLFCTLEAQHCIRSKDFERKLDILFSHSFWGDFMFQTLDLPLH